MSRRRKKTTQKRSSFRSFLFYLPLIIFAIIFIVQVLKVFSFLWGYYTYSFDQSQPQEGIINDLAIALFMLVAAIIIIVVCVTFISQYIYPEQTKGYNRVAFSYFVRNIVGNHGKPIRVKEGKVLYPKETEYQKQDATISLVDLNSALVLEKQMGRIQKNKNVAAIDLKTENPVIKVVGPGVNTIEPGESIKGVADLRTQFRIQPNVNAQTRDRIELKTGVFVIFTIGQQPDEFMVTMDEQDSIKILEIDDEFDPLIGKKRKILRKYKSENEFDEDDQEEIKLFFRRWNYALEKSADGSTGFDEQVSSSPWVFSFNADHVIAAAYSLSRTPQLLGTQNWSELPVLIATNIFRNNLGRYGYDELYISENPDEFPLKKFKKDFSRDVRNQGVLSYKFVIRKDGRPIQPGEFLDDPGVVVSKPQLLKRSKFLRDRGIKVIAAGFTELLPDKTVLNQLFDYWKATLDVRSDNKLAEHESLAIGIRGEARAKAQEGSIRNIYSNMSPGNNMYSEEVLAFRLYQALEEMATDPATRELLSKETLNALWNMRRLL
jgi:hypothetical protein